MRSGLERTHGSRMVRCVLSTTFGPDISISSLAYKQRTGLRRCAAHCSAYCLPYPYLFFHCTICPCFPTRSCFSSGSIPLGCSHVYPVIFILLCWFCAIFHTLVPSSCISYTPLQLTAAIIFFQLFRSPNMLMFVFLVESRLPLKTTHP
jgi:hypothetical protein